jgi:hypothetical protein
MKNTSLRRALRLTLPLLMTALILLATLISCTPDMDVGNNTELADQFMDHVIADDYDAAYGLVKATVSDPDFRAYWATVQTVADGAETYEIKQIGWNLNRSNGVTTRTTAHQAELDNGRIVLLRVVTQDGIEGIAGIHFSDITDFLASTEAFVPTVRIILWVVSALAVAFTVWMLVDCLRRKMKYKVVWAILIFFGLCFTFTVGETSNFSFNVGLFFQTSSIEADPGLLAVVTKLVIPVGAILYLCLRKKFTVEPSKPEGEDLPDPFAPAEAGATAEADATAQTETPAPATEADTKEGGEES